MKVDFEIIDDEIIHYTSDARNGLIEQAKLYTQDIIKEANKVEAMLRETGASQEVTENHIIQAVRRNKTLRKKKIHVIIIKILSEFLLFVSGLIFIPDSFIKSDKSLNIIYLVVFLLVSFLALILTITMHFKDGD